VRRDQLLKGQNAADEIEPADVYADSSFVAPGEGDRLA
jgi:hypothetical protein